MSYKVSMTQYSIFMVSIPFFYLHYFYNRSGSLAEKRVNIFSSITLYMYCKYVMLCLFEYLFVILSKSLYTT